MVDRRDVGSWLSGPRDALAEQGIDLGYRGQRLGLPETGVGSVAGFGRRLGALLIDWVASVLIARLAFPEAAAAEPGQPGASTFPLMVLGIFALEVFALTWLTGASFGQRILGIGVRRVDGGPLAPVRALTRTVLLCLAVPALVWDRDGRGLHDRASGSVCVRTR